METPLAGGVTIGRVRTVVSEARASDAALSASGFILKIGSAVSSVYRRQGAGAAR